MRFLERVHFAPQSSHRTKNIVSGKAMDSGTDHAPPLRVQPV